MSKALSIALVYKDHKKVVLKFGDLYPGSLSKVVKKAFKQQEAIDFPELWCKLAIALSRAFKLLDEHLILVSPLHATVPNNHSLEEELDELRRRNEENRIFIDGETNGRKYFCFGVTDKEYLEDLIYRYYDSGLKLMFQNKILKNEEVASALSSMAIREGEFSTDVFTLILEISFPSGKEFYVTARPEDEPLIRDVISQSVNNPRR